MKKILGFYQKNEKSEMVDYDYSIFIDGSDFNFILFEKTIEDLLNNKETHKKIKVNCKKRLEKLAKNSKYYKDDYMSLSKSLTNNDFLHFFNQFDLIEIAYNELDGLEEFLESNKEYLTNKKILIPFQVDFSSRSLKEVKSYYEVVKKALPKVHLFCYPYDDTNAEYESYFVDVEDYFKAYLKWDNLIGLIKSLKLSPLEEIAFIYDYLKNKKYQKEDKNEPWYTSRGIINVLVGDKIVCVGYVALFRLLVESLGHCYVETIYTKKCNEDIVTHVRAKIYIQDDKYRVDGNYIFDVTFESKKRDDEDNSNYYYFFLRTLEDINKFNNDDHYERVEYDFLDWPKIEELMKKLPDVYTEEEFNNIIKDKNLNMTKKLFCIRKNGNVKEDLLCDIKSTYELYNRKIDPHMIIKLFYNIRKIEYYLDPDNTSFTYDDLFAMSVSYLATPSALYDKPIDQYIDECLPNVRNDIEIIKITRNLREYILKK